jgi:ubiquinone biosynthesis protein UbiJ
MSYAETMNMLDLMLLVATLDNRNEIEELRDTVQRLDRRLDKLVA